MHKSCKGFPQATYSLHVGPTVIVIQQVGTRLQHASSRIQIITKKRSIFAGVVHSTMAAGHFGLGLT